MLRKSAAALALLLSCIAPQAFGLGLGAVTVESALNQPLQVRIEVLQLGDTRLEDVRIQIAAPEDFQRFNIERAVFLNNIRFSMDETSSGNFVVLTSNQIVREPYLSFILETRWANGRLLSEHTILLDLPVFEEEAITAPSEVRRPISTSLAAPASQASAPSQPTTAPRQSEPEQSVQPILEPEIIAPSPQTEEPAQNETAAFGQVEDNDAETVDVQTITQEQEVDEPADPEPEVAQEAISTEIEVAEEVQPAPEESITTGPSDTLSDIALRVRPNSSVSLQQTMLAIQELNPDAFVGGNINRMRSGQVLRVPTIQDIEAVDQREAISEVSRQNQEIAVDVQPLAAPSDAVPQSDEEVGGQLSVITGDPDAQSQGGVGADANNEELDRRIEALENQLALREEAADRARIEREELESRLADLDTQIAAAQEIIRLQDLQLAQLQQSLADAAVQAQEDAEQQAAQVAAQPVIEPVQIRQPTLLDTIMSNSMLLIAGVGVLILLLVGVLLRRNKASKIDEENLEEIPQEEFAPVVDDASAEADNSAMGAEFQDYDESVLDSELDDIISIGENSNQTKVEFDEESFIESASDEDICAQADSFLAQDEIDQAEKLVTAAISENPGSDSLQLKLLSVFAAKGDLSAFEAHADSLPDSAAADSQAHIDALRSTLTTSDTELASKDFGSAEDVQREKEETASFLDDLGIDLDSFDDDSFSIDDEVEDTSSKPSPTISLDDMPQESDPEEMDLTFDLAGDPGDELLSADDAKNEPDQSNEVEAEAFEEPELDIQAPATSDDEADASKEPADEQEIESFDFDDNTEASDLSDSGAAADADDIEIDTLEFDVDTVATTTEPDDADAEPEEELETFSFEAPDAPAAAVEEQAPANESEESAVDENVLDFDFDKSEIQPEAAPETKEESDLETFDFDLDSGSADTIVEKSAPDSTEEIDFDLNDTTASEADPISELTDSVEEPAKATSDDFDFDLNELEIEEGDAAQSLEEAEISLSDEDFAGLESDDLETAKDALSSDSSDDIDFDFDDDFDLTEPAATSTAAIEEADDDLGFLTIEDDDAEVDVSNVSIDDEGSEILSDEDETATKLELAYAYQKMGDAEGAKEILQEVISEGSPAQVSEAKDLLESLDSNED